ncbi:MAG TPA: N-6 DNA methylase [Acidimicrobiales bacterium]|nr:N-6 DNA methylase [Acidimicrobiales bacterium]
MARTASPADRKRRGVYYTPLDVVDRLLDLSLDPVLDECGGSVERVRALRVLDPAAGSGNFLVAAGDRIRRRLEDLGLPAGEAAAAAFGECLAGVDLDRAALDRCAERLTGASLGAVTQEEAGRRLLCADAFDAVAPEAFHLVVGNPPFLSQLATGTARAGEYSAQLRRRFGPAVAGLTDTAVLFLLLAVDAARPAGGVVCLIQPLSFLSTRDAAGARAAVLGRAGLRAAWMSEDRVFDDASVRVCAPVLVRGEAPPAVRLLRNRSFAAAGSVAPSDLGGATWAALLAAAKGVPDRALRTQGRVGDVASATADFRDQYYGLRGRVVDREDADDADFPPLLTSGLLDPAHVWWGRRSTRFDKVAYRFPRVDVGSLEPPLREWARRRLVPKLLLATQTKVLEAFVDGGGRFLPSVPVVTVTAGDEAELWRLGALLSSPPVTMLAARRHLGAALSSEALKLRAADVLELPLPARAEAWQEAAGHFEQASAAPDAAARRQALLSAGRLMCAAFGLGDDAELVGWWQRRLPSP